MAQEFVEVGSGLNVYEWPGVVEGRAKWLETPADVIEFTQGGKDVSDVIVVVRGGTTTFLTMALNAGIRGVITLQGAPESHLGIIAREYGIPCVMSVKFSKGVRTSRGETIPADGARVRIDASKRPTGVISVDASAPVDDSPPPPAAAGMSEEQMAQIMALLANFLGKTPHGPAGDAEMRKDMKTSVLTLDDASVKRTLTPEEVNELIRYYTWNEWDALAARATEGESGLIPRQEYEAMGILNCWFKHPEWMEVIEKKVGIDGMVGIGARAKKEVGTKINLLHLWAMATAPSFGRGIALELKLHDKEYETQRIVDTITRARRLYKGLWGDGAMLSSMREYRAPVLDSEWIDRFAKDRLELDSEESRSTFQRFNGATELLGFLLHFDNRLGLGDSGPYPTKDGGFVLVRDLFINEPAFPWSETLKGLPYAVTIAMFFAPGSDLKVQLTDLSTVFTTPANYLPYVKGVAAYTREKWDSPMSELKPLSLADMGKLRHEAEAKSKVLYERIAGMSKKDKILAGAMVYTAGFVLPAARAAGVHDDLVANHGFLEVDPAVEACYQTIISGVATEMIPRLFLTGSWGNPVPEKPVTNTTGGDELAVTHALRVRGMADAKALGEISGLDMPRVEKVLEALTERGHAKALTGRIKGFTLTPSGVARAVLLAGDAFTADVRKRLTPVYEAFLGPNRAFKQVITDWQQRHESKVDENKIKSALGDVHDATSDILERAVAIDKRFEHYLNRLDGALARFDGGDANALARPLSGSYHDVWMELHQDLLLTLGKTRTEHDE